MFSVYIVLLKSLSKKLPFKRVIECYKSWLSSSQTKDYLQWTGAISQPQFGNRRSLRSCSLCSGCWGTLWLCWSSYVTPRPTDGTRSTSWWRGWRSQTAEESCFSTLQFWPDMPQISLSISAAFCVVIHPSLHHLPSYLLLWSSARCPLIGVWRYTGHSTKRVSTATGGGWWRWLGLSGR